MEWFGNKYNMFYVKKWSDLLSKFIERSTFVLLGLFDRKHERDNNDFFHLKNFFCDNISN